MSYPSSTFGTVTETAPTAMASSSTIRPATAAQVGSYPFDGYLADSCIYHRAHTVGWTAARPTTFGALEGRSERY